MPRNAKRLLLGGSVCVVAVLVAQGVGTFLLFSRIAEEIRQGRESLLSSGQAVVTVQETGYLILGSSLVAAVATLVIGFLLRNIILRPFLAYGEDRRKNEERILQLNASLEQRVAERTAELKANEERFRALFYTQYQFIGLLSPEGILLEVNETALAAGGLAAEEVIGKPFWETPWWDVGEERKNELRAAIRRAAAGEFVRYEVGVRGAGGKPLTIDFSIKPVRDVSGRVTQLIPEARDITDRNAAMEALRQSEEQFRAALECSAIGMALVSLEGQWLRVNHALCRMLGYSETELLATDFQAVTHPDDLLADLEHVRNLLEGASDTYQMEKRFLDRSGSVVWGLLNVALVRGRSGEPLYFISQVQNIAERRRNEAILRRESAILDQLQDAVLTFDADKHIIGWNKAAEQLFGWKREEILGRHAAERFPPEMRGEANAILDGILAGEMGEGREWQEYHRDGSRPWVYWRARRMFDDQGNVSGIIGVVTDITEQKKAREEARLSLERIRLAAKAGGVGIWEVDLKAHTLIADEQILAMYGAPQEPLEGDSLRFFKYSHPDDLPRVKAELEEALRKGGTPFDTEFRILRADDGQVRHIRAQATVLRNAHGAAVGLIGTNWDVTGERLREDKLTKALAIEKEMARKARAGEESKSAFLAVMSHEIRTPMNGILGFAELIARLPDLPKEGRDYAETIVQSGETLLHILDDILDFSRLEAGHPCMELRTFSPRNLLCGIGALLDRIAREKGLVIQFEIDPGTPDFLLGDDRHIRQVLLNLAGNAIKFTERGSVTMGIRPGGDAPDARLFPAEFYVRDTGMGIPREQQADIFEPFVQADSSISRRYGGTGLGLTISKRFMELMGGSLGVVSEPGAGAEFVARVFLQREAAREEPPPSSSAGEVLDETFAERHPLRILIAEDDRVNMKLVVAMLQKLGYSALSAQNGREAIEIYQTGRPDCVLMDLQMPEMDGITATTKIREIERTSGVAGAFIAALTANTVPADRQRCMDAGMNEYLNKPVQRTALARILEAASSPRG